MDPSHRKSCAELLQHPYMEREIGVESKPARESRRNKPISRTSNYVRTHTVAFL